MPAMKLNDGTAWEPTQEEITYWVGLYPAVDVPQELNAMAGWLDANKAKRKTPRGIKRFVNSWLARAQDSGGSPMVQQRQKENPNRSMRTRDMTTEDELTHIFIDTPEIRAFFLEKYGQYFLNGERVTA